MSKAFVSLAARSILERQLNRRVKKLFYLQQNRTITFQYIKHENK